MPLVLLSCIEKTELRVDLKPIYSDYKNALQVNNLYGKVKKIEYFKTTFQNTDKEDKSALNKIEEYTDFGELKKAEYFDNHGELLQTNVIDYNENKKFIKSISIGKSNNSNILQTVEYDSIKNMSELNVFVNDTIDHKMISYFGRNDYPIKRVTIKGNDTIEVNFEYDFDNNDKIKSATQKEKGNNKSMTSNLYKYDNNNNLVESSYKTEWLEMINEIEWKDRRILKQTSYTIAADLKKYTDNITEFDILYNPINEKIYENSELNRELEYDYEFDQFGNWIKRIVSMKEYFAKPDKFIPIYIETRKIEYWK